VRLIGLGEIDRKPRRDSSPLDSWSPAAPDAAQGLDHGQAGGEVSVITDTAGDEARGTPIDRP
jgi:hypothetical protein